MILIADCGGTKVNWCLLDKGTVKNEFTTQGMNALMLSELEMEQRMETDVVPMLGDDINDITNVYFYGAGCVSKDICDQCSNSIKTYLPYADIEVATDLLGTCRAVCGDRGGIVCILGTGSNSCLYNGKRICENVSPLGFILGDEGSGAYLGKILVADVLKRQLPDNICRKFLDAYKLDTISVVQKVYREPHPNRFLASLTPFLKENIDDPSIRGLVVDAFKEFFKRNVCLYGNSSIGNHKVNFCGSIAFHFKDVLAEAAAWYGYNLGTVISSPMEGLVKYHSSL